MPIPNPGFDPAKYHPELEGVQPHPKKAGPSAGAAASATAPVSGWQASKDATLTIKDGKLQITSTGGDPYISMTKLPKNAKGPFKLSLRLSSTASGNGQVFFTTPKNPRFGKEQTVPLSITHDGAMHDYELALPEGVETLAPAELRDLMTFLLTEPPK